MIAAWLSAARLCGAIVATWPSVPAPRACAAALAIETTRGPFDAELVAAIAMHESVFRLDAVGSRGECGPMQVAWPLRSRARLCSAARSDVFAAYHQGVDRLWASLEYCGNGWDVTGACFLNVYAAGPAGKRHSAGEAAREFRALAAELARHLTADPSS